MFINLYLINVLYLTFLTNLSGSLIDYKEAYKGNIFIYLSLIILAVFFIIFEYIIQNIFIK